MGAFTYFYCSVCLGQLKGYDTMPTNDEFVLDSDPDDDRDCEELVGEQSCLGRTHRGTMNQGLMDEGLNCDDDGMAGDSEGNYDNDSDGGTQQNTAGYDITE